MKQYITSAFFIILSFIFFVPSHPAQANQNWHYQASAQVTQPALVEAGQHPRSFGRSIKTPWPLPYRPLFFRSLYGNRQEAVSDSLIAMFKRAAKNIHALSWQEKPAASWNF